MCLPCHFHNEADSHAGVFICAAESIHHIKVLAGELLNSYFLYLGPHLFTHRVVVVLVAFSGPPNLIVALRVVHNIFVFGRTAGIDTRHHIDGIQFGEFTLVKTGQGRIHLGFEKLFVRRVVNDFTDIGNAILA